MNRVRLVSFTFVLGDAFIVLRNTRASRGQVLGICVGYLRDVGIYSDSRILKILWAPNRRESPGGNICRGWRWVKISHMCALTLPICACTAAESARLLPTSCCQRWQEVELVPIPGDLYRVILEALACALGTCNYFASIRLAHYMSLASLSKGM